MEIYKMYVKIFIVAGILGWIIDTAYRSLTSGFFVIGAATPAPFSPVYGFGAIIVYWMSKHIHQYWIGYQALLYAGALTLYEYISGEFSVWFFGRRLWDYSEGPLNYNGHIDALHFVYWGALALLFQRYLLPIMHVRWRRWFVVK